MDFVLLGISAFYFVRGCLKGFLSMLFSLAGVFFVAVLAWKLTETVLPFVQSFAGGTVFNTLRSLIDGIVPGEFDCIADFQTAVSSSRIGFLFNLFLAQLFANLTFDGTLTAGQILAPTLSVIVLKVLTFILLFLILEILLKLVRFFLNKIIKKCGLSMGNRILGGLLGLAKGLIIFGIFYVVMTIAANVLLNEGLLEFVRGGAVSNFLYENFISKIIGIFY